MISAIHIELHETLHFCRPKWIWFDSSRTSFFLRRSRRFTAEFFAKRNPLIR